MSKENTTAQTSTATVVRREYAEYYDHWWNKFVRCEIIIAGKSPIDDWLIIPLDGSLAGREMFISFADIRA